MKLIIVVLVFAAIAFFAHRSCTQGYDRYAVYVQVEDEAAFAGTLHESDDRIVQRGKRLTSDIVDLDAEMDGATGPNRGVLRWYECSGIDCEEGWEGRFH